MMPFLELFDCKMMPLGDDLNITIWFLYERSFCWKCKFLLDCRRKNSQRALDSPYCFDDSKFHYLFVQEYGNTAPVGALTIE